MLLFITRPDWRGESYMTAASKSGMSQELTDHEVRIRELGEKVGVLRDRVTFLVYVLAVSIFGLLFLSYVNYRAIHDLQDQSHVHPREVPSAQR